MAFMKTSEQLQCALIIGLLNVHLGMKSLIKTSFIERQCLCIAQTFGAFTLSAICIIRKLKVKKFNNINYYSLILIIATSTVESV